MWSLTLGSIITFDKENVDYAHCEVLPQSHTWYVTRLKDNALYRVRKE